MSESRLGWHPEGSRTDQVETKLSVVYEHLTLEALAADGEGNTSVSSHMALAL